VDRAMLDMEGIVGIKGPTKRADLDK